MRNCSGGYHCGFNDNQEEMKGIITITALILAISFNSYGQSAIVKDFTPICDTLAERIGQRTTVQGELKLKAVMKRGNSLDFYFTESLGDFPWRKGESKWFRKALRELFPEKYEGYRLGEIYSRGISLGQLETPDLTFNGNPAVSDNRKNPVAKRPHFVKREDRPEFDRGLSGMNIALWQSHGRYYDTKSERWRWQRPCLFQTCEDMFTQSFVIPYLVPMIENAGGYVLMPRERDIQTHEIISDNDTCYDGEGGRLIGRYEEKGKWTDAGEGFADTKPYYTDTENPFTLGTARQASAISPDDRKSASRVTWTADIPEKGEYSVYVSYKSLPESTSAARYTVHHLGGRTDFTVNQKMGGGIWIYLGTFEFEKEGRVVLENRTPKGYGHKNGSVVTADAVRFGGGMGNIARGSDDDTSGVSVSGMPRSAEAARYWLQWSGADAEIYSQNEGKDDYKDDYMSRGDWVAWLSGGSDANPGKKGKAVPIDLALGFHSDAGVTPGDSTVGTLAIYTLKSEGIRKYPTGESRMTSREYADIVQSQVVNDLRSEYDSLWSRRAIWDRGYRESRTPSCPSMLLELLSHQNFADMKYGLNPSFRFTASRAVYKGMLKYLSNRYGFQYVVQPLPVEDISVSFAKESGSGTRKAVLKWRQRHDPLEPTASADGYILHTRTDSGGFDNGKVIENIRRDGDTFSTEVKIMPGHIYSFRITACNRGGRSFPSETVSIGLPSEDTSDDRLVLVVNNFDRISSPAFFDTPSYAGFENGSDSGVPYIRDISFTGEMYQRRRDLQWASDDNPGFGASFSDKAGTVIAGNSFDYAFTHGKAIMAEGHPFCSCSNEAFCNDSTLVRTAWAVDIICGKQVTVPEGRSRESFRIFPEPMQDAIKRYTSKGGNIIISGSYIGTDIWDRVYPVTVDENFRKKSMDFAVKTLGFRWEGSHASRCGEVRAYGTWPSEARPSFSFCNAPNPKIYCVEAPDGIAPANASSRTFLRYADTSVSAGILYQGECYRTVCIGFPIEVLESDDDIRAIIARSLSFLSE